MDEDGCTGSCERCSLPLVELDAYGERLRGCVGCNNWQSLNFGEWRRLPEDDIAALRGVGSNWRGAGGEVEAEMTAPGQKLLVQVVYDEIIVTLPGSRYSVTYYKPNHSPQLLARCIADRDDLRFPMTAAEFLAQAWRLANDKARELGWIV